MNLAEKIEKLKQAGVIASDADLSANAKELIDMMSDDELEAAISARAKISDEDKQKDFDESIHAHGF